VVYFKFASPVPLIMTFLSLEERRYICNIEKVMSKGSHKEFELVTDQDGGNLIDPGTLSFLTSETKLQVHGSKGQGTWLSHHVRYCQFIGKPKHKDRPLNYLLKAQNVPRCCDF
jgi:hypothetical protein